MDVPGLGFCADTRTLLGVVCPRGSRRAARAIPKRFAEFFPLEELANSRVLDAHIDGPPNAVRNWAKARLFSIWSRARKRPFGEEEEDLASGGGGEKIADEEEQDAGKETVPAAENSGEGASPPRHQPGKRPSSSPPFYGDVAVKRPRVSPSAERTPVLRRAGTPSVDDCDEEDKGGSDKKDTAPPTVHLVTITQRLRALSFPDQTIDTLREIGTRAAELHQEYCGRRPPRMQHPVHGYHYNVYTVETQDCIDDAIRDVLGDEP